VVHWPRAARHFIDIIHVLCRIVSSGPGHETILPDDETIFCFGAERRKPQLVINLPTTTADSAGWQNRRDSQMRTFSFILAFAFVLAGPSLAGSSDANLPGVGTFAYTGSPVVTSAPSVVVAAR
jgi:hypothetical protein